MHYIPQSTSEMLRADSTCQLVDRPSFHYLSAPLYLLTVIVGLMLIADWVLSSSLGPTRNAGGIEVFGFQLALLAAVLGGARILYRTLDGLLSGRIGADFALTLACLAAIVLRENHTAGLVVFISLVGESIEGYTIDRARWAVRRTFDLSPTLAHRCLDGNEQDILTEEIRIGDILTIRPGEQIPVDGQVVAGTSVVDQSPFTGESLPVDKSPGEKVFAGTLNQFGALTVVAESIGEDTALARVAQLVGAATASRANLEKTADRLARWFLPAVLLAALATLVGWRIATGSWKSGCLPALGVLVVACPCPLILATPCAVMASLAWLARRGVVVKGSAVLERLAVVDTFAFDKTGTLTQGALAIGEIFPTTDLNPNDILRIAAIAERNSEHLLARLLVRTAEERGLDIPPPLEFSAIAGAGVTAKIRSSDLSRDVDRDARPIPNARGEIASSDFHDESPTSHTGTRSQSLRGGAKSDNADVPDLRSIESSPSIATILVGNRRALEIGDIAFSPDIAMLLKEREAAGESPMAVVVSGTVIGIIGVRETIRPESRRVLEELRAVGIKRFVLLTGDRPLPADAVVKSLGMFEHVATEQLPADKAHWIEASRRAGSRVAMVGDGTNDAPALAAADVGIALGRTGGDMAAMAGEIVLLGDPLRPLPGLVRLSRALVRNIWQSILIFAFGLNGIGVLACSLRWLDPIGGAVFHEFASLAVMANAMRLLWFEAATSPGTAHWRKRTASVTDWIVENASASKWIYRGIEHWRLGARLTCAVALAAWLLSGIVLLTENQQVVVSRFGRYEETLTAGLHWRWPWPLEQLNRAEIDRIRSVAIGYREPSQIIARTSVDRIDRAKLLGANAAEGDRRSKLNLPIVEWTNPHNDRDASTVVEESVMLTADEVPVELTAEVQYRIVNLKQFVYSGSRRPDDLLRATAESILREVAATASLDQILTEKRAVLERQSVSKLRERIERYGLGVEIVDLQWIDVHPPQPVVPAYRQVADALEYRELLINEAETHAARTLLAAVGDDALSLLQRAGRMQVPDASNTSTSTDWRLNDELWEQLKQSDTEGQSRLSGSAAAILLEGQTARVRREMSAAGASLRLELLYREYARQPRLTSQYLYWTTMTEVLSQRPLTIVDPKAAGRQQIWLDDPMIGTEPPPPAEPRKTDP